MHNRRSLLASARVKLIFPLAALSGAAQAPTAATETPMQRCDRLPVVILQVDDKEEKHFLVDTSFARNDDHAASCTDWASIPPANPWMFKSSTAMKP